MNDAAEFETSLTGAIDFFQNLRRKLETLDTETGVQHDQLQNIATTVAALRQDQQQAGQTLAVFADRLRVQGDALRQELQSAVEQQVPAEQLTALETRLASHTADLRGLLAAMQTLGQDTQTLREQVQTLSASLEPLEPAIRAGQEQWRQLYQDVAEVKNDLAAQRHALGNADQLQQSLQRQQDRLKHVETFMGKVAADTNSTRQILNVLQTDLTTQSDTLREFDQFWRDSFATAQDRPLALETSVAAVPAVSSVPDSTAFVLAQEPLDELTSAIAAIRQEHADVQQELAAAQAALADQDERLTGQDADLIALRNSLSEQLQNQQDQLGELASAISDLRQAPVVATGVDDLAADLTALHEALTPRIEMLDELQQSTQRQIHDHWDQISQIEAALNELRQAPAAVPEIADLATAPAARSEILMPWIEALDEAQQALRQQVQTQQEQIGEIETTINEFRQPPAAVAAIDDLAAESSAPPDAALTSRIEALDNAQQALRQQAQVQQEQLGEIETALNALRQEPAMETATELFNAELANLHHALAEQHATLTELRQTTELQIAELSSVVERQRQAEMQHELSQSVRSADSALPAEEIRQSLADLQETVAVLENRLVSQAQAFSGNFEQFRGLRADIQGVQDHLSKLESSPRQLTALERSLAEQAQDVAQLREALQQVQADSQQMAEATLQGGASQVIDLEVRLAEQSEQLNLFSTVLETIRTDAKATQDKVVTMATNVAKRMHEFQNQMTVVETTQGERLQELEQKIIWLQAALETRENQPKPRRWFGMPASLTSIVLMVGTALLMVVTRTAWTAG
ncbi:MAG: hypothetical protein ACOYMW_02190 [Candidatus Competibacteraceae bacterium]